MDVVCSESDDELFLTAKDLMKPHEQVAPYLGLSEQKVTNIRRDHPDSEDMRKLQVLREWKRQKASGATRRILVKAFLKMKDRETAEQLVKQVKLVRITHRQSQPNDMMPDRALQRYPNWDDLGIDEKKRIKEKLIAENDQIQGCYSLCLSKLIRHYSENPPTLHPVKIALISYIRSSTNKALPDLKSAEAIANETLPDVKVTIAKDVKAAETIEDIFYIIAEHSSWFNYRILELVVEAIDNEKGTSIFSSYKESTLKPYLERSIYLVPCKSMSTYSTTSSSYVPCVLVVDELEGLTAKEVTLITQKVAKLLHIPSLQLMSYECGSLHLIFGIYQEIFEYEFQQNDSPLHKYIEENEQENTYYIIMDINL